MAEKEIGDNAGKIAEVKPETELMTECRQGNYEKIAKLLENAYEDINKQNPEGLTALMIVCKDNKIENRYAIIKLFCDLTEFDYTIKDNAEKTIFSHLMSSIVDPGGEAFTHSTLLPSPVGLGAINLLIDYCIKKDKTFLFDQDLLLDFLEKIEANMKLSFIFSKNKFTYKFLYHAFIFISNNVQFKTNNFLGTDRDMLKKYVEILIKCYNSNKATIGISTDLYNARTIIGLTIEKIQKRIRKNTSHEETYDELERIADGRGGGRRKTKKSRKTKKQRKRNNTHRKKN